MSSWNFAYDSGTPPWDIGRPQPAVLRLAELGAFRSPVLDAGCGTGENALELASRGFDVVGIDGSSSTIRQAREKSATRGLPATFVVGDALDLTALGRTFESVLDCGLFHTFADDERARYVDGLAAVVAPAGMVSLLCFSDEEPWNGGPRRVTREEIREAFAAGWRVESIVPEQFVTLMHPSSSGARAWRASIVRLPEERARVVAPGAPTVSDGNRDPNGPGSVPPLRTS